jgi:FAD/FMN-containing dehydrogenase
MGCEKKETIMTEATGPSRKAGAVEGIEEEMLRLERHGLEQYSRDFSFAKPVMPASVVRPKNTQEVETIVRFANENLIPIVPVSSGPPHFRGDTVPGQGGAIIVDLSDMKKIIKVDRVNRVAMIEPGVRFRDLREEVGKAGLRPNTPLLPRSSKSVVGSLLEREPVTMPCYHWDISDPLDCLEVVFGTGDRFRTGSAAGPGDIDEQATAGGAQDEPLGPGQTSWHRAIQGAQGSFGIVTWATVRCEVLPQTEEPFIVGASSVERILELASWLIRLRLVNECFVLNSMDLATIFSGADSAGRRYLKEELPAWTLFFIIAGYDYYPEERVRYMTADVSAAAQRLGLVPVKAMSGVSAHRFLTLLRDPSSDSYWKMSNGGACQDLFFLTTYDRICGQIETVQRVAGDVGYSASQIGCYLQPVAQGSSCHCEFNFFYDGTNNREAERVKELSNKATRGLLDAGAFFSRPYGENARTIMNRDAATVGALRKIKAILDPNGIMNPGKLCF